MAGITSTTRPPYVPLVAREVAGVRPVERALRLPGLPGLPGRWAATGLARPVLRGWSWRGSLLLAVVLLHPYLLVLALPVDGAARLAAAASMSRLLAVCGLLAAAVILEYEWRIDRRPSTGWLSVLLAFVAAQWLPFALLALQGSGTGRFAAGAAPVQPALDLVVLPLAALAARGGRLPVPSPLAAGLTGGALAGTTALVLADHGVDGSPAVAAVATGAVAVALGAAATALLRSPVLPRWSRVRLAAFLACLLAGRVLAAGDPGALRAALAVGALVAGVAIVLSTAATMLREGITESSRRLADLARRTATAEGDARQGRERLHEVNATVAGIAQASRLLLRGPGRGQRRRLEALLDSEMARLERMLARRGEQPVAEVCLDEVLQPLVDAQLALGAQVGFAPTGLRAWGRADDLAEVVHILLSNAARHAPGAPVTVSARGCGDRVEVRVRDEGPGVPPGFRPTLFTWGGRRPGSPGQGIGLQLARRLMLEQSGNLTLEDQGRPGGATFVLTIPSRPPGLS